MHGKFRHDQYWTCTVALKGRGVDIHYLEIVTSQLTHNVFSTLLESFAELIWHKRCSNLVATFAKIYFESLCR